MFIQRFKNHLKGGGARPNQFRVELVFPDKIRNILQVSARDVEQITFLCHSASLPASTVEDTAVYYRGRQLHFAGERSFAPWTVSVYVDTDFITRTAFEVWSQMVMHYARTEGTTAPADYQTHLRVFQIDRDGRVLKSYKFFNAYPTSIGNIQLSYDTNNSIETFDVDFTYDWFTPSIYTVSNNVLVNKMTPDSDGKGGSDQRSNIFDSDI